MAAYNKTRRRKSKHQPADGADPSSSDGTGGVAHWFLVGMVAVALVCFFIGSLRHGFAWKPTLAAGGCWLTGIGFVAIGLLELEWLERIIGFTDGVWSGLAQWFWTGWSGSLSDLELIGRRGATVIWVGIGFPIFVWGCLLTLRIVEM
jgi:hypothetical protein